jgi:hypothetical protein
MTPNYDRKKPANYDLAWFSGSKDRLLSRCRVINRSIFPAEP